MNFLELTSSPQENRRLIAEMARPQGIGVLGTADVRDRWGQFWFEEGTVPEPLPSAIVMGVALSQSVLGTVVDGPSLLYKHHYNRVNLALDQCALLVAQAIERAGSQALPIPASQVVDWKEQRGHLSHRAVGELAGLGWRGRNNLLVHPEFGSQVRYVTVLTDLPLTCDTRIPGGCGQCFDCLPVCPVGAIKERKEEFDLAACAALLRDFAKRPGIGVNICGLCVRACPGQRRGPHRAL